MVKIGFIGLGAMGGPMAATLANAGHVVTATDLSIGAIDRAVAAGCLRGETVAATVRQADIVITMLPAGQHMVSVYTDRYGVIAHAKPGALFVDCSTIDEVSAQIVIAAAAAKNFSMVLAPASGDPSSAVAAALKFELSGDSSLLERATAILSSMGYIEFVRYSQD